MCRLPFLLSWLLTAVQSAALTGDWCLLDHEERLGFNKRLTIYNCPPATPLLLPFFLWQPLKINVHCPSTKVCSILNGFT